jgi:hypothetical protein
MYCPSCGRKLIEVPRRESLGDKGMQASMGTNLDCACGAHVLLKYFFTKEGSIVDGTAVRAVARAGTCLTTTSEL